MPAPVSSKQAPLPESAEPLIAPRGRKILIQLSAALIPSMLAVAVFQDTFNPLIALALALLGTALTAFATAPSRRFYTPVVWAMFFSLGCVVSFGDLLLNEATYRSHRTPLTGAFAYTDAEMWQAALVMALGVAAIMAGTLLAERVLMPGGRRATAGPEFRSVTWARVSILLWTFGGLALTLFLSSRGIGRTGMTNQTELPFRLAGVLTLARAYLVPCFGMLILNMLMRGGLRGYAKLMLASIFVVGFVGSLTALSRGHLGFLAITVSLFFFVNRGRFGIRMRSALQYAPWIGALLLAAVFYVDQLRTFGFRGHSVDVASTVAIIKDSSKEEAAEMLHLLFSLATSRIGGLQELLGALSAPQAWSLANPAHIFLEHDDETSGIQKAVIGFVSERDGTVATGVSLGLWGSLMLSGSCAVLAGGTALAVLFLAAVEAVFLRRGLPAVALTLAVYFGLQFWGFANVSIVWKIMGITLLIAALSAAFLRRAAQTSGGARFGNIHEDMKEI